MNRLFLLLLGSRLGRRSVAEKQEAPLTDSSVVQIIQTTTDWLQLGACDRSLVATMAYDRFLCRPARQKNASVLFKTKDSQLCLSVSLCVLFLESFRWIGLWDQKWDCTTKSNFSNMLTLSCDSSDQRKNYTQNVKKEKDKGKGERGKQRKKQRG